ncbi:response regulator transcription factor [Geodermatophilus sp. TF02-6]|uniref:response regulator transcription factor n=1 Tax=Geodermatophilus sp. TF02-6 TaxID=2250575 RepID=UPI001F3F2E09|nr:response regulator transcription factor [Geodermatophilus sp. TF02-6]
MSTPPAAGPADRVSILLVDDDPLVRAGLRLMLDGVAGITVVAEAADGDEVLRALRGQRADVVLMDLRMPRVDGVEATRQVRRRPDAPQVVVLTTFDSDEDIARALRAGAAGFLLKDAAPATIVDAVLRVARGEPAVSPSVLRRLMDRVADTAGEDRARASLRALSPRELDVTLAVARGATNAEIGGELYLSTATVKAHLTRILAKLDLANRTQLALLVHDARLD